MLVGVTGGTGFIGTALRKQMSARGWQVRLLPRGVQAQDLAGCDAIVNLAGESVAGRWTAQKKAEIARSRLDGTRALVDAIASQVTKPRVLVSASAVGIYGDRGDEPLFEWSRPGDDFLSNVCEQWEEQAQRAEDFGVRTVMLRTGIVLGQGGALAKMIAPFRFGAGGPLGSGRQFVPWIHLDDIAAMYVHAIEHESMSGPVNAVTPDYATNARLSQAIGAAMRRPALLPAPSLALRAVLGEFAGTVLASQLVVPARAPASGFRWSYPRLESALQSILAPGRESTMLHEFETRQTVRAARGEVFDFFAQTQNLQLITPPSLRLRMTGEAPVMHQGALIEYRLAMHGVPIRWKTMVAQWNPPHGFADVQLHGPYALWEHRHSFEESAGGTEIRDRVTYALPVHPFGELAAARVRREVQGIFDYRSRVIEQRFDAEKI